MAWLSLFSDKMAFIISSTWQRTPIKAKRITQHFSLTELKRQRNGWMLSLVSHIFDLLLLPETIDLFWQVTKPNTRPLNHTELQEVKKVFGDALPYDQIRIDEWSFIAYMGALLSRSKQMGICTFYTVNFTRKLNTLPSSSDMGWLIHELVHVAQMHHVGSRYIWEAVYAQQTSEGYDYGGPNNLVGKSFWQFNREQQGDIVRHYYEYVVCAPKTPLFRTHFQPQHYQSHIDELQQGKL